MSILVLCGAIVELQYRKKLNSGIILPVCAKKWNFFFFLEKFKYYVYLVLLHYLHFFQEAVFITDNWFFEGSLFITILSGIEHPSVLFSFLLFKGKCHEGWGVWLEEVWLMFDARRKCWKLNTMRSKINKPVQRITIQFWE